ncbi:uncharacterized protein LOC118427733 isoform X1 [Branchiostoma floridae]|uniref:Uncharacterized protein LOC118427733 isoform X1 n=2 Tax=Branchiostoma floridae TaxID=7739 RepID=A0A9J7M2V9_BRAFL|nr:uncharacterized protein LOC118427733 isoform X1 [Branchiostoma floridae]
MFPTQQLQLCSRDRQPTIQTAPGTDPGPLQVRNMEAQDVDFVAQLLVESFSDKFEHAVGKSRMEGAVQQTTRMLGRSRDVWHRYLIAVYDGRPAGLIVMKFHGDTAEEDFQCGEACSYLGCWGTRGLVCLRCCTSMEDISAGEGYVDRICVDANFRGKGIGKMLLDRADFDARRRGCTAIFLWVKQGNRAVHLYERQGYVITETANGIFRCFMQCGVGSPDWCKMEKQL